MRLIREPFHVELLMRHFNIRVHRDKEEPTEEMEVRKGVGTEVKDQQKSMVFGS